MADTDFDPRFDPAFQPGYDPSKHKPAAASRAGSGRPTASTTQPDRQVQQPDTYVAPPVSSSDSPPQPESAAQDDIGPRRRNPLLVTLWVLSALFVASGVYGLRLISDRVTSLGDSGGFGGADYYLLQSYTVLAPLLIVLGLATAVGTIFVLAVRRLPRR